MRRDERGATALEFAFIAGPFFLMLFAIIEITYMFFLSTTLENATMDAARKIRTGEYQLSGAAASDFKDEVCENLSVLVSCGDNLHVDVRVYDGFTNVQSNSPVVDGDFNSEDLDADFGEAGDIVVARAFYVWDVFTPTLGTGLSNLNGGKRLIVASTAFRNEPFGEVEE